MARPHEAMRKSTDSGNDEKVDKKRPGNGCFVTSWRNPVLEITDWWERMSDGKKEQKKQKSRDQKEPRPRLRVEVDC